MKNLAKLKIALEDLKQLKETEQMSEETYNRELRRVYHEFRKLKKKTLEQELYQEVVEITIQPMQLFTTS